MANTDHTLVDHLFQGHQAAPDVLNTTDAAVATAMFDFQAEKAESASLFR